MCERLVSPEQCQMPYFDSADGNNVTEVQVRNWAMSMCCVPGQNTLLSVSLSLPKSINRCQCNEMLEVRGSSNASSCFMLSELR